MPGKAGEGEQRNTNRPRFRQAALHISTFLLLLSFAAIAFAAPPEAPKKSESAQLIEQLGSAEFKEREAAMKRLDELGPLAIEELRAACKSENPEIAERAKELVRKIERRTSSEKALSPTWVELNAKKAPLDAVLADLSKQSNYEVVLGGLTREVLAAKKITIATGKVPFWTAVLKVCEVADLQIAVVGGFPAPGSAPYLGNFAKTADGTAVRFTLHPDTAVVLEGRDPKKRPASVHGAMLVEAFEVGKGSFQKNPPATALQFWPEPKIAWQSVANVKLVKAIDGEDRKLTLDPTPPLPTAWVPERMTTPRPSREPSVRHALLVFKPGDEPPKIARELSGVVIGLARSAPEPLATVKIDPKKAVKVTGLAGVEMTASVKVENGKQFVEVRVEYDPIAVVPVRTFDPLPDVASEGPVVRNRTVHGLRVTDADGRSFNPSLLNSRSDFASDKRISLQLALALPAEENGPTEAKQVVFWGTYPRPLEVPFTLKDVPLR